jgi:O-acetylserine/cysteine efflux transporter
MICTVAIWGFNFVATRIALEVFSVEQLALSRSLLTFAILLPWWQPFKRISWPLMAAALAIGSCSFYLLYKAINITESLTTVAVGTQLLPPLTALLALLFYRETISRHKWLGILVATLGAVYVAGIASSELSLMALGLTFLAVLFYSGGSLIIAKSPTVGIRRMLAWISALSLLPLGLMTTIAGPIFPDPGLLETRHWLAMLFACLLSGLIGQAVLFSLYRKYPISFVAPWILLTPVFAALSSILVLGESVSSKLILGGSVILVGVWLQQRSDRKVTEIKPAF